VIGLWITSLTGFIFGLISIAETHCTLSCELIGWQSLPTNLRRFVREDDKMSSVSETRRRLNHIASKESSCEAIFILRRVGLRKIYIKNPPRFMAGGEWGGLVT